MAAEKAGDPLPPELERAAIERPERYLELQLPAWAYRFHQAFGVDTFKDDRRGGLLRDAVIKRLPAEAALARDRRGLLWIEQAVSEGDEARRSVQDELFAANDLADLKVRIAGYGRKYADSLERIDRFHKARTLFERIAARLPYYGEWAILDDIRNGTEPAQDGFPSPRLAEAFKQARRLGDLLEGEAEPEEMATTLEQASIAFERLEDGYRKGVEELATGEGATSWLALDNVLSTPLIPTKGVRKLLLDKILKLELDAPEITAPATPPGGQGEPTLGPEMPLDHRFLREALGLARLDVELRKLGAGGHDLGDGMKDVEAIATILRNIDAAKPEVFDEFAEASKQARRLTQSFVARRARSSRESRVSERKVAEDLRAADRALRFRNVEELKGIQPDGDLAAKDLEDFARWSSIRFHARRLAQDFARNVGPLNELAKKEFNFEEAQPVPYSKGSIIPEVPSGPVEIDREKHSARMGVGMKVEEETGATKTIPEGRAFVGILVPGQANEPRKSGTADAPGRRPRRSPNFGSRSRTRPPRPRHRRGTRHGQGEATGHPVVPDPSR